MDPTNVPAELVEAADLALATKCVARPMGGRCDCPTDGQVRTIIAAALTRAGEDRWDGGTP